MKHLALAVALLAPSLASQQNIVYHDSISPTTGVQNAFPFGAHDVRTQQLIPQSALGSTPGWIQDLFVDSQVSNTVQESQVFYGDYEIRMGLTQLTTLTNDWNVNLPSPTTVYRGPLLVRFVRDQWCPLGLPNSYLWLPLSPADNLVVDFICWQVLDTGQVPTTPTGYYMNSHASATNSISRAYRLGWVAGQQSTSAGVDGYGIKLGFLFNDGNFVMHNGSSAGSSGQKPVIGATSNTWPQAGQTLSVTLGNGPPNLFATLVLGTSTTSYASLPLPLDMGLVGAPGCKFWNSWEVLLPIVLTDPAGASSFPLAIPPGAWTTVRLYGSWLCFDPAANAFGFVPSGFATLIL